LSRIGGLLSWNTGTNRASELYCIGIRLGEATRLRMADTDLRRGILTVQRSKGRSRILPVRDDLVAELNQ